MLSLMVSCPVSFYINYVTIDLSFTVLVHYRSIKIIRLRRSSSYLHAILLVHHITHHYSFTYSSTGVTYLLCLNYSITYKIIMVL